MPGGDERELDRRLLRIGDALQSHFDGPPVVAVLKDRVSCSGDGDRVGRLVDVSRYHA